MHRNRARCAALWALVALWLGYSAAVLAWHASSLPPGDVCLTR